ncbi:MAG: DUF2807 domain-containing protein [Hyphomonadaceae bacterium]
MERFVFIVAVTVAILFGVGWAFGPQIFRFDGAGGMGSAPMVDVAPGQMEAQTFAGDRLDLRWVVGRVVITPEDRTDFVVEIDNSGGVAPMPVVSVDEGRVIVDGQLRGRISHCRAEGAADLRGYGAVTAENAPVITIRAPRSLNLDVSGGALTEIAASEAVEADFSGCGDANIADVAGPLSLDVSGAADITTGAADRITLDLAGATDVTTGAIANGANVDVSGAGTVIFASLTGGLEADAAGAGNMIVRAGAITTANLDLAGAGDVQINAPVERLVVSIAGAGDVDVDNTVGDLDAEIAGAGSVTVREVTGTVQREILGPGRIEVGQ